MQELNQILIQGLLHHIEESILVVIVMTLVMIEDHIEIAGPLKEEGPKVIMEDHLKEDATQVEDILEGIIQVKIEDPLMMEDPLMVEDPLMMEDPADDGGPPNNGRPPGGGQHPRHPGG